MKETITFIGNGNMALSIANGLKDIFDIEVVGRDIEKLDKFEKDLGIKISKFVYENFNMDNKKVILCVKPINLQEVSLRINGKASELYSVLAGTTLDALKSNIKSKAIVRVMPNLCASVSESMTTMTGDIELKKEAEEIFKSIGDTLWLSSEKEVDIATAVAGSGPAYLALIHEALCDGAVKQGMKRVEAIEVANGLFKGFGNLIPNINASLLKDGVMSPGGTTAAGYSALEENGVRYGCIKAVEDAFKVTQK
ncbi:MAG: pyrroline-5-carboxylate reductase [Campylobacterota bacterium]|nr:pyrroline-5-carboxylate reductase [Campylobacterota bacterium]